MDNYAVQVVTSSLTGTATDRTKTATADESASEEFWVTVSIAAEASDITLTLSIVTDPKIVVIYGGKGISVKLGSAGTDSVGADPIAVIANEDAGLDISELLVSNSDTQAHAITVVAYE